MTGRPGQSAKRRWLLIAFLALLACASVLQAAHFHRDALANSKCALCVAAHHTLATPIVIIAVTPQRVYFTASVPQQERPCLRSAPSSIFIRPPPAA
jgi:hypothetical protein